MHAAMILSHVTVLREFENIPKGKGLTEASQAMGETVARLVQIAAGTSALRPMELGYANLQTPRNF